LKPSPALSDHKANTNAHPCLDINTPSKRVPHNVTNPPYPIFNVEVTLDPYTHPLKGKFPNVPRGTSAIILTD
jgi:hypothetical protein